MIKDSKIQGAEIINEKDNNSVKKSDNPNVEKVLILILGILIGIAIKTEALQKITIGFDDYLMHFYEQDYDLNEMQDKQIAEMMTKQEQQEQELEEKY